MHLVKLTEVVQLGRAGGSSVPLELHDDVADLLYEIDEDVEVAVDDSRAVPEDVEDELPRVAGLPARRQPPARLPRPGDPVLQVALEPEQHGLEPEQVVPHGAVPRRLRVRLEVVERPLHLPDAAGDVGAAEVEGGALAGELLEVVRLVEDEDGAGEVDVGQRGLARVPVEEVVVREEYQLGLLEQGSGVVERAHPVLPTQRDEVLHVQHGLLVVSPRGRALNGRPPAPHAAAASLSRLLLQVVTERALPALGQLAAPVVHLGRAARSVRVGGRRAAVAGPREGGIDLGVDAGVLPRS